MAERPGFWPARAAALRPSLRAAAIGGGAAAAAGGAAACYHRHRRRQAADAAAAPAPVEADAAAAAAAAGGQRTPLGLPRLRFSPAAIEAFAGAMGEVAQICLLYPLDTIKVRCQAQGLPARAIIAELSRLGPAPLSAALFAGVGQAALASVLVGAVHFASFCSAKRLVTERLDAAAAATAAAAAAAPGEAGGGDGKQRQQQHEREARQPERHHLAVSHGAGGSHFTPVDIVEPDAAAAAAAAGGGSGGAGGRGGGGRRAKEAGGGADAAAAAAGQEGDGGGGRSGNAMTTNLAAAAMAAVATALVEAPLELFRHNAQAGTCAAGGNFMREMWRVVTEARSPLPLYRGLTAYSLEAIPYDISELMVVGSLNDGRAAAEAAEAAGGAGGALAAVARAVPQPVWDLGVGAAAGAVAVLASMPFDVVKTWQQTHPSCGGGLSGFAATARLLVARGGPGALWLGLGPRLAHQVPGACICWLSIHSVHRYMTEHHLLEEEAPPPGALHHARG
ncbi:mitochondrial carrier protein [Raphidocelis subcapitata]|uniref:Mitochondrial carrier protein n=1 Tax=Raphidocelis subcapitata TaxID=307507 RepID=A0A2V0NL95_9CHLO|nr:mitochondrial carrier protein [Raphidocelis subcapitata]|eukprot:GBF88166.1 mitochondrial carrier protein [Raphidocelis subcapitata]